MKRAILTTAAMTLLLSGAGRATAGIILNTSANAIGYTVSGTDLLQTNLSSSSVNDVNNIRSEEGVTTQSLAPLTNGTFGPADLSNAAEVVAIHNGTLITYNLDTTAAPLGYNITNINTYAGWRDNGRSQQDYSVSYSTVSDPNTFILLDNVTALSNGGNYPAPGSNPNDTAAFLSDSTGILASNVAAIQFSFSTTENTYVGYREFDVLGAAAVPEPATMTLLGIGLASLAGYGVRRRKQRAATA